MSDLILSDPKIIRPSNVSRRGFLRSIGVTALALAVPKLVIPDYDRSVTFTAYAEGTVKAIWSFGKLPPGKYKFITYYARNGSLTVNVDEKDTTLKGKGPWTIHV